MRKINLPIISYYYQCLLGNQIALIRANLTYVTSEMLGAELSEAGITLLIISISDAMEFAIKGVTYPKKV